MVDGSLTRLGSAAGIVARGGFLGLFFFFFFWDCFLGLFGVLFIALGVDVTHDRAIIGAESCNNSPFNRKIKYNLDR